MHFQGNSPISFKGESLLTGEFGQAKTIHILILFAYRSLKCGDPLTTKISLVEWKEKNLYGSFVHDFETLAFEVLHKNDNKTKVPNVAWDH